MTTRSHFISEPQRIRLEAIARQHGFTHDDLKVLINNLWACKSTTELIRPEYERLCDEILPAGFEAVSAKRFYEGGL